MIKSEKNKIIRYCVLTGNTAGIRGVCSGIVSRLILMADCYDWSGTNKRRILYPVRYRLTSLFFSQRCHKINRFSSSLLNGNSRRIIGEIAAGKKEVIFRNVNKSFFLESKWNTLIASRIVFEVIIDFEGRILIWYYFDFRYAKVRRAGETAISRVFRTNWGQIDAEKTQRSWYDR